MFASSIQAAAILVLWRSGRFDTLDIAAAIGVDEPVVVRILDVVRGAECARDLRLVEA